MHEFFITFALLCTALLAVVGIIAFPTMIAARAAHAAAKPFIKTSRSLF